MKNVSGKVLIFYTFQNRKENEFNMTWFRKSSPQEPKIRDVLHELPLDYRNNSYHFRFKSQFIEAGETITGWIDISNLLAKVPIVNQNIVIKILEIPQGDRYNKLFTVAKMEAIGLINPNKKAQSDNKKQTQQAPLYKQESRSNGAKPQLTNTGDLFEFGSEPKGKVWHEETTQEKLKTFQNSFDQEELAKENERTAALQFEDRLLAWGYSGAKTTNNITTLLATLHDIWPEWPPISLSDMLKPEDVNALFKKAVIKVHPDKNRSKDYRQRYLSKRIFELLNEAKKNQAT